jgi:hypothetical protein
LLAGCRIDVRIAFTIAYLLRILHSRDPELEANLSYEAIQRALPAMQEVGFQEDLVSVAQFSEDS